MWASRARVHHACRRRGGGIALRAVSGLMQRMIFSQAARVTITITINPGPSGGALCQCRPFAACHAPEQQHQILNLDAFERTYRVLDLADHAFISAASDKPVELFDRVLPREGI